MKYGFFGLAIIMTGLLGILFIGLFQSITVNNESEYYVIKEAMEASMLEAVDIACYRDADKTKGCGERIKISEQKFVENFSRRFAENISGDVNTFELDFYDIIESPPKASVVIKGLTKEYGIMVTETSDGSFNITNHLSGVLEYDPLINSVSGGSLSAGSNPDSDLESVELKVKEEPSENSTGGAGGGENAYVSGIIMILTILDAVCITIMWKKGYFTAMVMLGINAVLTAGVAFTGKDNFAIAGFIIAVVGMVIVSIMYRYIRMVYQREQELLKIWMHFGKRSNVWKTNWAARW